MTNAILFCCGFLAACTEVVEPPDREPDRALRDDIIPDDSDPVLSCSATVRCNGSSGPVWGVVTQVANSCERDGYCGGYKTGDDYRGAGCELSNGAEMTYSRDCGHGRLRDGECRVNVTCNGKDAPPTGPAIVTGKVSSIESACSKTKRCGAYRGGDDFYGDDCKGKPDGSKASYVYTCQPHEEERWHGEGDVFVTPIKP